MVIAAEGVIPSSASTASACSFTAGSVLARICAVLPIDPPIERIPVGIRSVWRRWARESRGGRLTSYGLGDRTGDGRDASTRSREAAYTMHRAAGQRHGGMGLRCGAVGEPDWVPHTRLELRSEKCPSGCPVARPDAHQPRPALAPAASRTAPDHYAGLAS